MHAYRVQERLDEHTNTLSVCSFPFPSDELVAHESGSHRLLNEPKPKVVGIAWVVECVEQRKRVDEQKFMVDLEGVNVAGTNKVRFMLWVTRTSANLDISDGARCFQSIYLSRASQVMPAFRTGDTMGVLGNSGQRIHRLVSSAWYTPTNTHGFVASAMF